VIAVEPESRNVALLKANLWRHQCANAVVLPLAAGRDYGYVSLSLSEENRGDHQVGWDDRADQLVPCARLDDLLAGQRLDFIKVDTQGVDHEVIAGLSGLVGGDSQTVMCEFWFTGMQERGINPGGVADEYQRLGFKLHLLEEDGSVTPVSPGGLVHAASTHPTGFVNVVMMPGRR
jgi:FkbM family methyltransferase